MDGTLPNKCTKFGAKIVMSYWVITFLVLGHFLKPHPVYTHALQNVFLTHSVVNCQQIDHYLSHHTLNLSLLYIVNITNKKADSFFLGPEVGAKFR